MLSQPDNGNYEIMV